MITYRSIPVAMYHHVNRNADDFLTVNLEQFESQMSMLAEKGYMTLSAQDFQDCIARRKSVPRLSTLLTFDDAWLDIFVYAFPILKKYKHKFVIFAVSDWCDAATGSVEGEVALSFPTHRESEKMVDGCSAAKVVCSWHKLDEMVQSGLCTVENHTASHTIHQFLADTPRLMADVERGALAIQQRLGIKSAQLSWPKGRYRRSALKAVEKAGIRTTYLVRRGVNLPGLGSSKVKRFTVENISGQNLHRQLERFASPCVGYAYSRLKPDRWFTKWRRHLLKSAQLS